VHVLLLCAAGARALCPQFLSELALEARGGARRVEDALLLCLRVQVGGIRGYLQVGGIRVQVRVRVELILSTK
jgi:hypothetical protein